MQQPQQSPRSRYRATELHRTMPKMPLLYLRSSNRMRKRRITRSAAARSEAEETKICSASMAPSHRRCDPLCGNRCSRRDRRIRRDDTHPKMLPRQLTIGTPLVASKQQAPRSRSQRRPPCRHAAVWQCRHADVQCRRAAVPPCPPCSSASALCSNACRAATTEIRPSGGEHPASAARSPRRCTEGGGGGPRPSARRRGWSARTH